MIDQKKTLFLIDGSSFLYRAYYALQPMTTSTGISVHAVFGFCRMIKKMIAQFQPHYCALVWDSPGKTVRHQMYTEYKATRQERPSDLWQQKELILEFADSIGMKQVLQPGIEADDLMYSLALDAEKDCFNVVLITSDKDLGQLINDAITVFDPFKDTYLSKSDLEEKYKVPLHKIPFYFALIGDSSDNIPGVAGIGPKTAADLVNQFESLEDLYANIDKVSKERTKHLLRISQENAFLSYQLFLLRYYPPNVTASDCAFNQETWANARLFFEKVEFRSFLKELAPAKKIAENKQLGSPQYSFKTITTQDELVGLCKEIERKKIVAIDTETTSLDPYTCQLVGISCCTEVGTAYYLPLRHHDEHGILRSNQIPIDRALEIIKPVLENNEIKKFLHHAKYDMHVLAGAGIQLTGLAFDTLVAGSLVVPEGQRIGLKFLSEILLGEPMISFADTMQPGYTTFADVPLETATHYAAADAHQTMKLAILLMDELKKHGQETLYATIEHPLIEVLYHAEQRGIIADASTLAAINKEISKEIEELYRIITLLIGKQDNSINLNSPKQLSALLFEELKLTPVKKTAQRTGFSTEQSVLEELAPQHPVIGLIMKYRELAKLKNTYLDALPTYIQQRTGRIHTNFRQTATATGRLASQDPNLQNIPVGGDASSIRKAFRAEEGHLFLSADYSQIELRVLAYLSQDEHLCQAFLAGKDIHAHTAAGLFDINPVDVSNEQRQLAKRINFSILYGLTPYGLSKDLKISFAQAKTYIEKYFAQYPGVVSWMDQTVAFAQQHGYVKTFGGRRRPVPGINEKNKTLFDAARRIAINTVAQGTAAEIMKLGMISVHNALEKQAHDAYIVLQIHDELLISTRKENVEETHRLVKQLLENVVDWNIPLVVTARTGHDWHDVTK